MKDPFLAPLLRRSERGCALLNERNGSRLAEDVWAAFDSQSRRTGLLGRASLPDDVAMIIAPTNAVHTFFMRFPIDVAFVTRDGTIVKACASVRPWRVAGAMRGYAAVELSAGTLARCDTVRGDRLIVVEAQSSDREKTKLPS